MRIWSADTGRIIAPTLQDHQGSIRGIAALPGLSGYATCSNDGTVMYRDGEGGVLGVLSHPMQEDGSPPFVLDV